MNIQHRTSVKAQPTLNAERSTFNAQVGQAARFDLEERLLAFSVRIIEVTESMKRTRAGNHLGDQLLRSGTAAYGIHGEAEGAESRADFVHKMRLCHKELRETRRWLRLIDRAKLVYRGESTGDVLAEADELVRIFSASIRTATANRKVVPLER